MLNCKGQDFRSNQPGANHQKSVFICVCCYIFFLSLFVTVFQFDAPISFAQAAPDVIIAGFPVNFPPHYLINRETGEPDGFGIDVMENIAKRSSLKVRYKSYDTWKEAHHALRTGRIDVIPNMGITSEREPFADFTRPLETSKIMIYVRSTNSDITNVDDLTGRHVAVVETNKGRFLMEERGGTELQIYSSIEQALLALLSGKADALIFLDTVINELVYESGLESKIKVIGESLLEVKRAIAVRKGLPELFERLDAEVEVFVHSPEYKEIYTRWHSGPESYWNVRRVTFVMGAGIAGILVFMLVWRYVSELPTKGRHTL